jgi:hypothetical protein
MSTINPIYRFSKSFIRDLVKAEKVNTRTAVAKEFRNALNKLQGKLEDSVSAHSEDTYQALHTEAARTAEAARNLHPPMSIEACEAAVKKSEAAAEALDEFVARKTAEELDLAALSRMEFKRASKKVGDEFASIKSIPDLNAKHRMLKVNLKRRDEQPVEEYVKKAHAFAEKFIYETLPQNRSPFVSPRLVTQGKDPKAALKHYKEAKTAFETGIFEVAGQEMNAVQFLADADVPPKLLKNNKFRIQVKGREDIGKLSAKIKFDANKSVTDHVVNGLQQAGRLVEVLRKDSASPFISHKLVRNNFVRKRVDFKALDQFAEAKDAIHDALNEERIQNLYDRNVLVKILRDGTFRIQRFNQDGILVKTRHFHFDRKAKEAGIAAHIENGIAKAEELAGTPLPDKVPTKQSIKNKFSPWKRKILNFIG